MVWLVSLLLLSSAAFAQEGPPQRPPESADSSSTPTCEDPLGPFSLRSRSPFQMLRLSLTPRTPNFLEKGDWCIQETITWTNLWAYRPGRYRIDGEITRSATTLSYGLEDWLQVGLEFGVFGKSNGFADSFIEDFHETFHLGNARREQFRQNDFAIEIVRPNGSVFYVRDVNPRIALEDTVLYAEARLLEETASSPRLSLGLQMKWPISRSEIYDGDHVVPGLYFSTCKRLEDIIVYAAVGAAYHGADEFASIDLEPVQGTVLLATEFRVSPQVSLIVQYLMSTGAAKEFGEFSRTANELSFGLKWAMDRRFTFEFALLENLFYFDNSPDFGMHFGVTVNP